jgi:hypothetical protein
VVVAGVDRIVEMIESLDAQQRVLIVQRPDGRYSFRKQFRADENYEDLYTFVWTDGYEEEPGWLPPGPYIGVYDSAETAKWEALCKVNWLASTQRSN